VVSESKPRGKAGRTSTASRQGRSRSLTRKLPDLGSNSTDDIEGRGEASKIRLPSRAHSPWIHDTRQSQVYRVAQTLVWITSIEVVRAEPVAALAEAYTQVFTGYSNTAIDNEAACKKPSRTWMKPHLDVTSLRGDNLARIFIPSRTTRSGEFIWRRDPGGRAGGREGGCKGGWLQIMRRQV